MAGQVDSQTVELPIPKVSSPWGANKNKYTAPCSLTAVMDEEYAKQLQEEESTLEDSSVDFACFPDVVQGQEDTSNDLLLAQMLQMEFDSECNNEVIAREKLYNGSSKVTTSFEKYCATSSSDVYDSYSSEDEDLNSYGRDHSQTRKVSKKRPIGPGNGKEYITKHDALICGRRNAKNMEKFPPEFASGNVSSRGLDLRLPNHVYNTLKQHSMKEEKYSLKVHEKKEHATHEQALDENTRLLLYKMVNSEMLENVNGCISTGKEAVVFHATGGQTPDRSVPSECAVKVFKTTLNEFKLRDKYIKDDYRFRDRFSKQNPRKIIKLWAEKEMRNLQRLHEAGIKCPEVVLLRKHILVMSFIGRDQMPAPKLKEAKLSVPDLELAYDQTINIMQKMYKECNLIHADMSEYNLLWHDGNVWVIDVSQSVMPGHPHGLEFLVRDCRNIVTFFRKMGVADVMTVEELFSFVSGMDVPGDHADLHDKINDFEKNEELLTFGITENPYNFDYFFKQSPTDKS